jgi:sterol 3beta-glucosyltransferase
MWWLPHPVARTAGAARGWGRLPGMRVLIIAAGSRGDVAPYTGLGARLSEAGHQVTISAHASFRALVEDAGLLFDELPGDLRAVIAAPTGNRRPSPLFLSRRLAELTRYLHAEGSGCAHRGCRGGRPPGQRHGPVRVPHRRGSEAAEPGGLPSASRTDRQVPTGADERRCPAGAARQPMGWWAGELLLATLLPVNRTAAHLRSQVGLPRLSQRTPRRRLAASRWPVFHGYSPLVLPRPRDWRPDLCGLFAQVDGAFPNFADLSLTVGREDLGGFGSPDSWQSPVPG